MEFQWKSVARLKPIYYETEIMGTIWAEIEAKVAHRQASMRYGLPNDEKYNHLYYYIGSYSM
jgi:hypothetical protein